ncbi:hypothetical protein AU509_11175 [Lonsdalea britannica]|uniref:Uncharacterized protein n=1 Tax=Lonsdalea britannica TaxID=1082704 RepID=A0AAD0SI20_9GAMM|nr:hypothetical protein [Lonsdalea britannica]AXW85643.1 hypothetical protein CKQ53_00655 [Lonsdalea britannica]OSM96475.1 hypothetical protein AU509_11175 [Lonsdalea britannica]
MPLYFDIAGLQCFQADSVHLWRDAVADAPEIVTDWLKGFYASNGKAHGAMTEVQSWLASPERVSFQQIASHLMDQLAPYHDLQTVDVVVVAHWTPDCVMGGSVTNYILHRIEARHAYAFAVSDCGLTAPFQALAMIDRYLPPHQGKALLMSLDQPLLLHPSASFNRGDVRTSGATLCLDRQPAQGRIALSPYPWPQHGEDRNDTPPEPIVVIGSPPPGFPPEAVISTITPDPSRLCAAPFYALADFLRANPTGPAALLSVAHGQTSPVVYRAKREMA